MLLAPAATLPLPGVRDRVLEVGGTTHRQSYLDIVMVCVAGVLLALAVVSVAGSLMGSF